MSQPGTELWRRDEARRLIAFGRGAALAEDGFGWLAGDGTLDLAHPCPLYVNARMTYVFALAHLAGEAGAGALAASGMRALAGRYADDEHGGWFAEIEASGRVTDDTKSGYAHAHTLLAAASAVAAGISGAGAALATATAVIETHFWSDAEGAVLESWNAGFTVSEPYRGANSNMHSVEAYLAAGDVTGDPVWLARATSIAERLINSEARAHGWRIPEHYDQHWQSQPDYNHDHRDDTFRPYGTTPGHSFEWARLLLTMEAAQAAQPVPAAQPAKPAQPAPAPWLREAATALFEVAAADAWSRDGYPGPIYTVDGDGQPVVRSRLHWVACEAVLAADALHRRTGEERYAGLAAQWWAEIDRYFVDRRDGSWRHELTPDPAHPPALVPAASTWAGKPDLYHAYQAVLLQSLPLSPTAATALARRRDV